MWILGIHRTKKCQGVHGMLGKEVPVYTLTLFHNVIKVLNCSRWGLKMKHVFFRDCTGVTEPGSKALYNETVEMRVCSENQ